jgi:transcription initiation factor IIE alpha subunit
VDNFFEEKQELDKRIKDSRFYRKIKINAKIETSRLKQDGTKVQISQNQKEYYSQKDIATFNLESYSKLIPEHEGYKVITSTYFVRFWGPVFDYKPKEKGKNIRRTAGMIAYTYIVLKSYCWGKDYCWISLQTLADNLSVAKNSVRAYLEALEEEGFIIRFWRESETNGQIEEESILIKVRQTVPFLTKEKIDMLPKHLKKEHNDFLHSIRRESEYEFEQSYNYTEVYEELRSKIVEIKTPEEKRTPYEQLMQKVTEKDEMTWKMMQERMKHFIHESSLNHWFDSSIVHVENRTLTIYIGSEFQKEHVEKKYKEILNNVMRELLVPADKVVVSSY